jgi:hypothetical protein
VPSTAELRRHFSPAFLKQVPPDSLLDSLGSIASGRPFRLVAVEPAGSFGLNARLESRAGFGVRVRLAVSSTPPHRIEGLLFQPVQAPLKTWDQVDAALERLGAQAALFAGTADGRTVHALRADERGAIGSAFKLYVLGALARAVKDGQATWEEPLAIRTAWKSLPSGAMRNERTGTTFSLRHYAEQMISVSDNTATDHLIGRLGRGAVEAQLTALGNGAVARNEPFLTTRELFALKLVAPPALRRSFAAAGTEKRRSLLPRIDALEPTIASAGGWSKPRSIGTLEWFASPAELASAIAALVREARDPALAPVRAILAINPGVEIDRKRWSYAGFKGGSEPGVLSMTWYLERKDGRAFVLSLVVDDTRHDIDAAAAVNVAESAIALLTRA